MMDTKKVVAGVGCGCAGLLGLVLAIVAGIFFMLNTMFKGSDPFKVAMTELATDTAAIEALGSDVEPGWFISGNISLENSNGEADMSIPVEGSKGAGTVSVVGTKTNGVWTYSTVQLTVTGSGETIDLLPLESAH